MILICFRSVSPLRCMLRGCKLKSLQFTLVELIIVMGLLVLIAGVVVIGIDKVVVDQRFRQEVSMVAEDLTFAQDLMLITGIDIKVKFKESSDNKGIEYFLESDVQLPQGMQPLVKKKLLKTIRGVTFDDNNGNEHQERGHLDLLFLSKGFVMSHGIITLSISTANNFSKKSLEAYIPLVGYPKPIKAVDSYEEAEEVCDAADNETFNESVLQDTSLQLSAS